MKPSAKKKDDVSISELVKAQEELRALKEQHGIKEEEGRISAAISRFFDQSGKRREIPVNRKKYLLLALFTGWMGGHRFYAKQYAVAILYLLFFWSGFPFAMTLIDLMIALPKETDADGMMMI